MEQVRVAVLNTVIRLIRYWLSVPMLIDRLWNNLLDRTVMFTLVATLMILNSLPSHVVNSFAALTNGKSVKRQSMKVGHLTLILHPTASSRRMNNERRCP